MSKSALNSFIKGTDTEAEDTVQYLGAILEQSLSSENMVRCIMPPPPPTGRETYCFWCVSRRRWHDSFLRARHLMNQPADFNQICMDITMERYEELIRFCDLNLISKVNAGLKLLNVSQNLIVCTISDEPVAGI